MPKRHLLTNALLIGALTAPALLGAPQDPGIIDRPGTAANLPDLVNQMMKFDKDGDGNLARSEVTDARLVRLFTRADADNNGTVTRSELEALNAKERPPERGPFGGFGGPGGPGGPMFAMPRPGELLPSMLRSRLKLTSDQIAQVDELQRDVDARMAKILDENQKAQIKQITARGPGGPPLGGGRGGPGGPGGGRGGFAGPNNGNGSPPPPPPE